MHVHALRAVTAAFTDAITNGPVWWMPGMAGATCDVTDRVRHSRKAPSSDSVDFAVQLAGTVRLTYDTLPTAARPAVSFNMADHDPTSGLRGVLVLGAAAEVRVRMGARSRSLVRSLRARLLSSDSLQPD